MNAAAPEVAAEPVTPAKHGECVVTRFGGQLDAAMKAAAFTSFNGSDDMGNICVRCQIRRCKHVLCDDCFARIPSEPTRADEDETISAADETWARVYEAGK